MSEPVEMVCANCGKGETLYRAVMVDGWEAITVTVGDDGQPVVEVGSERDVDWTVIEFQGRYGCGECGATSWRENEAFARPEYDCPQCKARGCPRCAYTGRETEPPPPHPGQLAIEAA